MLALKHVVLVIGFQWYDFVQNYGWLLFSNHSLFGKASNRAFDDTMKEKGRLEFPNTSMIRDAVEYMASVLKTDRIRRLISTSQLSFEFYWVSVGKLGK